MLDRNNPAYALGDAIAIPGRQGAIRSSSASTFARLYKALWPFAVFFVLAAVMTYPLITNLTHSTIYGITADADISRWDLWWLKTSLVDRHFNPYYTDMLYFPYRQAANPLNLYFHTLQPTNGLLALPILLLTDATTGPTLAYNLLMLLHFTLTGCAMFWLVRYLVGSSAAGLVAGFLFTFSPFHQYHLHEGQLELVPLEFLPLFLLFLHKVLFGSPDRAQQLRNGAIAVMLLLIAAPTSWYLTLYMLFTGGLLAAASLLEQPARRKHTVVATLGIVFAWLVLVAPFLVATIKAMNDPSFTLVSGLDYEVRMSLTPGNLVLPYKEDRIDPAVWHLGMLGFTAMGLGALGIARWRRRAVFWVVLIVLGGVLSLGPYLSWTYVSDVKSTTGIPLPYLLLRELPFFSVSRVPRRLAVLADLGLGVLAGAGTVWLLHYARLLGERLQARVKLERLNLRKLFPRTATACLLVIAFTELAVIPQPVHDVQFSPFFTTLANDPTVTAIMEMPVTTHYLQDHERMIFQTVHHKKIVGGYLARRVEDYYNDPSSPFNDFANLLMPPKHDIFPASPPLAALAYYDMPYLLMYKQDATFTPEVATYVNKLFPDPSSKVYEDAQLAAYRVPNVPHSSILTWVGGGWYDPETKNGDTWRWSDGLSHIYVSTKTPLNWRLQFSASTLQGEATLEVDVNGKLAKQVHITAESHAFDAGILSLTPGQNDVTFKSDGPAVSPADAGMSQTDTRKLAFVVRNLSLK